MSKKFKNILNDNESLIEKYYDQNDNLVKELEYDSGGFYSKYEYKYDSKNNQIKSVGDYRGNDYNIIKLSEYDLESGHLKQLFSYCDYGGDIKKNKELIKFEYFPNGKVFYSILVDDILKSNDCVESRYYQYDSNHNKIYCYILWKSERYKSVVLRSVFHFYYDEQGNCLTEKVYRDVPDHGQDKDLDKLISKICKYEKSSIEPKFFKEGILNGEPFNPQETTDFKYDRNGNKISSETVGSYRIFYEYNDRNMKIKKNVFLNEKLKRTFLYEYDEENRLIREVETEVDIVDIIQRKKTYYVYKQV